ncbi:MAG TPA: AsmA family protein [Acidobacteriota bacterium]|nr:AsmA family protein [Acidobacteriota bacterium]
MSTVESPQIPPTIKIAKTHLPPHRPRSSRLLWKIGGVIAVFLVLAVLVVLFPSVIPTGATKSRLEQKLGILTGRNTRIGTVSIKSIVFPTLVLEQVELDDDPAFQKGSFLRVRRLETRVPFSGLWGASLEVSQLKVEGAQLNLVHRLDGEWNWSSLRLLKPNPLAAIRHQATLPENWFDLPSVQASHQSHPLALALLELPLEIEKIQVFDSSFVVSSESKKEAAEKDEPASQANSATPSDTKPGIEVNIFRCSNISTEGVFSKNRLACRSLMASLANGTYQGELAIDLLPQMFQFEIKGSLKGAEMKEILQALSTKPVVTGAVSGDFRLRGKFAEKTDVSRSLEGEGKLELRDGTFPTIRIGEFSKKDTPQLPIPSGFPFPIPKLPFPQQLPTPGPEEPQSSEYFMFAGGKPGAKKPAAEWKGGVAPGATESQKSEGTRFELLTCSFSVDPEKFQAKELMCNTKEKTEVAGHGTIFFRGSVTTVDFQLKATMTAEMAAKLQKSRPVASVISSLLSQGKTIRLPLKVTGDIRKPDVEVDYVGFVRPGESQRDGDANQLPIPDSLSLPF